MSGLDEFRDAWQSGAAPDIEEYLPSAEDCQKRGWDRETVLQELLIEDIRRRRLARDDRISIEDYLRKFAELTEREASRETQVGIVEAEYACRIERGESAAKGELLERFEHLNPELSERFLAVDSMSTMHEPESTKGGADPFATLISDRPSPRAPNLPVPGAKTAGMPEKIGRYRILKKLGSGGFADVYLAEDKSLNRQVAIKAPNRRFYDSASQADEFLSEARRVATLRHDGIVTVHDVVQEQDGRIYFVMEYVGGGTLADAARQFPLETPEAASIGVQIAAALAVAHGQGIIHRDLKPANVLMSEDGRPLIADFGLAIELDQRGQSGIRGTPAFMSPEQAGGDNHLVDERSDLWSVGVILYLIASGRMPHCDASSQRDLLHRIRHDDVIPPRQFDRSISAELETVIMRCLDRDPEHRYQSMRDLEVDLKPLTRRATGSWWPLTLLPIGILMTVIGVFVAMGSVSLFLQLPMRSAEEASAAILEWFLAIGLLLGCGPIAIVAGNWYCCRQVKMADSGALEPCRVSRKAVICFALGVSSGGWGPLGLLAAVGFAIAAAIELRQRRRWLTGWKYIGCGLVLGSILSIPSIVWWSYAVPLHQAATLLSRAESAYEDGQIEQALSNTDASIDLLSQSLLTYTVTNSWARVVRGKYNLAAGNVEEALDELSYGVEDSNMEISAAALTWRAQLNRLLGDDFQANDDLSRAQVVPFVTPPEPVRILRPEKIEGFRRQDTPLNMQEDVAPMPPAPMVDPEA